MTKSTKTIMIGTEANLTLTALTISDVLTIWKDLTWEGTSEKEEMLSPSCKVNLMTSEFGLQAVLKAYKAIYN